MTSKKKIYITIFFILILTFFTGNFSYPYYFNRAIDFINNFKFSVLGFQVQLPYFPDVPFRLGLDLQGGTHLVYEADLSNIKGEDHKSSMQGLRDVIERRVNLFGVQEPMVQVQEGVGHYRLIVELAGVHDPAEAIRMIGETPYLEFKELRDEEQTQMILDKKEEIKGKDQEEISKIPDWHLAFEDPYFKSTSLTGKYLKKAELGFDQTTYKSLVLLEFDDEGAKIFEELTEKNVGKVLAVYIDNIPISMPTVQEKISGGKAQITGNFTIEEARALSRNLSAGALPVPIVLISQQTVEPTLGAISLEKSLRAGMLGFLAIIIFMIIFYRIPGILASLALIIYVFLILTVFKLVPVTLTLAGIAGFILSTGMAVDANVLIFSRMREELGEGKNLGLAIEDGFSRAWPSIRDGNITTLIVTVILFAFGTSFIKGFALTLSFGILISMFSAIIISKNFLRCFVETKLGKIRWLW
ncbi:MAG: protein translocase subunit SecD [Candidatus Nealsonbacteria bacterium]|nr:protein translocase subunit SecD [Candidatus Nealsonbacteria bacterium]